MFDFRRGSGTRNFLSRRQQWRLLLLVMVLGLVFWAAFEARDPSRYRWLWAAGEEGADGPVTVEPSGEAGQVDTRVQARPADDEIPGAFISPAPPSSTPDEPSPYFPGVKPVYLKSICDDEPFRYGERDAWFHLLEILAKTDQATLQKSSTGRVTFVQLFQQSEEYRGELVTTRGTVVRAHRLEAPKNDYGIHAYYQTWVQPADNRHHPMVVYCLRLPDGFPTGMSLSEEAEITGFFFKRWAYKAQDTMRSAPVLLARTVRWYERPEVAEEPPSSVLSLLLMIAGSAAVALATAIYIAYRTRRGRQVD